MRRLSGIAIERLKGVGEKRGELFRRLGVETAWDLLRFYPRDYQDWSQTFPIDEAPRDQLCVVRAKVISAPSMTRVKGGKLLFRLAVTDGDTDLHLTFFNNRYIDRLLLPGKTYLFRGKLGFSAGKYSMTMPEFAAEEKAHGITPVYSSTQGLSSRQIGAAVASALGLMPEAPEDPLPQALREEYQLCHLGYALKNVHFPRSQEDLDIARRRLVFQEFLVLQLGLTMIKSGRREQNLHRIPERYPEDFAALLPFRLTGAQQRAIAQGVKDMAGNSPMNRLIQGDVGSGKTAVAAALCWVTAKAGWQAALMAPTEILAGQHYQSLEGILGPAGLRCALLTGGVSAGEHKRIHQGLAAGEIDLVIGTHALISQKVAFRDLALVITDEQHRFGVNQRVALAQKGASPHLLVMSATPIPRTLALMAYGDLDISVLDELPPGRRPVETYLIGSDKRERAFRYIQKHLDQGRQGYIVCPLIENDESGMMSVNEYAQLVRRALPAGKIGVLHGKMKPGEKESIMKSFAEGQIQLLVATTVVEVGVDVPNAAIMMIENAERYGLSQLHQLRGRIGRGEHQSTCILVSDYNSPESLRRLNLFKSTNDGFAIADADLKFRGPGDFFGQRQHGLPQLKIADMFGDMGLLKEAQRCARRVFRRGALETKEYGALRQEIQELFSKTGDMVAL